MNPFREQRMKALAGGTPAVRPAGRFRAELATNGGDLYLYDVIDPWGGYWGISASEVVQALQGLGGGPVTVHVNSGGGDVFEAIAMHSAIAAYPGATTAIVDGLAASAASMLLTAFDRVEVAPNAQVMIHDAWSFEAGDEAAFLKAGELLGRTSQNMAGMYAAKGGGEPDEWRARMQATTWYVGADEIITAGLADGVVSGPAPTDQQQQTEPADAFAQWDLSIYGKVPAPREVKIDAKIMPVAQIPADLAAALEAEAGPEFRNAFAAFMADAQKTIEAEADIVPLFGNKFREALKEMTS